MHLTPRVGKPPGLSVWLRLDLLIAKPLIEGIRARIGQRVDAQVYLCEAFSGGDALNLTHKCSAIALATLRLLHLQIDDPRQVLRVVAVEAAMVV